MLNTSLCRGLAHYPFSVVRFLILDGRSTQFFLSMPPAMALRATMPTTTPGAMPALFGPLDGADSHSTFEGF